MLPVSTECSVERNRKGMVWFQFLAAPERGREERDAPFPDYGLDLAWLLDFSCGFLHLHEKL